MRNQMPSIAIPFLLFLALLLVPASSFADDQVPARLRHADGAVNVQRAEHGEIESAVTNLPVFSGDRVWTDARGRAELVLPDGTFIWLDTRSTLDFVELGETSRGGERILRLDSGSLFLAPDDPDRDRIAPIRVDTPSGSVVVSESGLYRVDVDPNQEVWLSVYRGTAELVAGGLSESVRAGERTRAEPGTAPARATAFNTAEGDAFSDWQAGRLEQIRETIRYVDGRDYVPRNIDHHVVDLVGHGSWFYHDDFGTWGWRPSVSVGWTPFRHGRWVFGAGSWLWVSSHRWGWTTSHFGRWHHTAHRGWVWFPGRVWSPAWVHWFVGPRFVGWVPVNFFNRPAVVFNTFVKNIHHGHTVHHGGHHASHGGHHGTHGGKAVPRGKVVEGRGFTDGTPDAWTFVPADEIRADRVERVAVSRAKLADADLSDSKALVRGPLRLENPGRAMDRVQSPRTAQRRGQTRAAPDTARSTTGTADRRRQLGRNRGENGGTRARPAIAPRDDSVLKNDRRQTARRSGEAGEAGEPADLDRVPRAGGVGVDSRRELSRSRRESTERAAPARSGEALRRALLRARDPDRARTSRRSDRGDRAIRAPVRSRRDRTIRTRRPERSDSHRPPAVPGEVGDEDRRSVLDRARAIVRGRSSRSLDRRRRVRTRSGGDRDARSSLRRAILPDRSTRSSSPRTSRSRSRIDRSSLRRGRSSVRRSESSIGSRSLRSLRSLSRSRSSIRQGRSPHRRTTLRRSSRGSASRPSSSRARKARPKPDSGGESGGEGGS